MSRMRCEQLSGPGIAEAGASVLPEGLEQLVAGRAPWLWTHGKHGALGEPGQQVEGVAAWGHGLGRTQFERTGKHGQRREEGPLVGLEHVVGPADGVVHGPVPRVASPSHCLEYPKTLVKAVSDFGNADRARPRRGQLNRQRDSVEASTDLDNQWSRDLVQSERRVGGLGPSNEERDGGDLGQFPERDIGREQVRRPGGKRIHRPESLTGHGQRFRGWWRRSRRWVLRAESVPRARPRARSDARNCRAPAGYAGDAADR